MKRAKLEEHLHKYGCEFDHHGGRHDIWLNPVNLSQAPVPRHREIKSGTVRNICRQLGIADPSGG
jgi:mRNA interferase HicA